MILTAVAIVTNLDVNFDQFVAEQIPDVNLTASPRVLARGRKPPARDHGHEAKFTANGPRLRRPPRPRRSQTPARRPCSPIAARAEGCSAPRPNSPKPRTGSTRPAISSADARLAARTRGAGRLLDLHLHQLHPHAALPEGVGRRLPRGRPDDRRRRDAGVLLRARRLATSPTRSNSSASATRSSRTTTWAPGTPTATSTGPPTT